MSRVLEILRHALKTNHNCLLLRYAKGPQSGRSNLDYIKAVFVTVPLSPHYTENLLNRFWLAVGVDVMAVLCPLTV